MGVFDLFTTAKAPTSVNFASGGKHALDTVAQQAAAAAARSSAHFPHPVLDPRVHLLPSLLTFPTAVRNAFPTYSAFLDPRNYLSFYTTHADSFQSAIAICIGFSVYVYVMQEITGNASQVDGLWTFLPVIYTTHFTFFSTGTFTWPAPRLLLLWALHVLWSTRLTYNAIRRGMFRKGEEDYRWPLLRASMSRLTWEIFTITFIAPAQNVLLAITALPAYVLSLLARPEYFANQPTRPTTHLTPIDAVLALALIVNLTVQFIADHQQQLYQGFKRGLDITCTKPITLPADKLLLLQGGTSPAGVVTKNGKAAQQHPDNVPLYHGFTNADKKRGFVTRGLWAWSRHPNFACEQTTWWIFYAYTVITFLPPSKLIDFGTTPAGANKVAEVTSKLAAKVAQKISVPASLVSPPWWSYLFNYAVLGAVSMNILFLASTAYSEGVSAGKYPAYASYQKRVGMFLPIDTLLRGIYYWFIAPDNVREQIEAEVWGAEGSAEKKKN